MLADTPQFGVGIRVRGSFIEEVGTQDFSTNRYPFISDSWRKADYVWHLSVTGRTGIDRLYGEEGNDKLKGGKGRDILMGGDGKDTLVGGKGSDTFVIFRGKRDIILDFDAQTDFIGLTEGLSFGPRGNVSQVGRRLIFTQGSEDSEVLAILKNVRGELPTSVVTFS